MDKETLEEAAEWLNKKFNGKGVEVKIIDWGKNEMHNYTPTKLLEEYSKWQQEKMYSEEEVNLMFDTLKENSIDNVATITNVDLFISSWKRQFKKK